MSRSFPTADGERMDPSLARCLSIHGDRNLRESGGRGGLAIGSFAWDTTVWVFDVLRFYYRVFAYSGRWRDLINEECDGKFHERLAPNCWLAGA